MDNPSPQTLQQQAHDNAVEAGRKLLEAKDKLEKAEELMVQANVAMSNARKFNTLLKEREKKLDRAFVLLNRERQSIKQRQLRVDQRDLLLNENVQQY